MPAKSTRRKAPAPEAAAWGFGASLRRARADRALTLREVSERSGVSIPYLSDLERGVLVNPTLDTLKKIAEALDVSLNQLLGLDEQKTPASYPKPLEEFARSQHFRQALAEQAQRERVPQGDLQDEWLRALAGLRVRGRVPQQPSDYLFIFEAIRRALDQD